MDTEKEMSGCEEVNLQKHDGGDGFKVWKYQGRYLHRMVNDPPARLKYIKDFQYREGDIFICSYPKCGLHWMKEMLTRILSEDANLVSEYTPLICLTTTPERIENAPSPRIIATHLLSNFLPREHIEKKGKILLLMRNPKDVAVSYYEFIRRMRSIKNSAPWEVFLDCFMKGEMIYNGYDEYYQDFEAVLKQKPEQIKLVVYEDLIKDCLGEMRKVVEFLGLKRSDSLVQEVVQKCEFSKLKPVKLSHPAFQQDLTPDGDLILYRKGSVGDWKNWFTVAQNERMDRFIQEKMGNTNYNFQYTLP